MSGEGKVFILSSVKDASHAQSFFFSVYAWLPKQTQWWQRKLVMILLTCCVKMLISCKIILIICCEKNNFEKLWLNDVVSEHWNFFRWSNLFYFSMIVHKFFICANYLCYWYHLFFCWLCHVLSHLIVWFMILNLLEVFLIIAYNSFSYWGCLGGWSFCRWQDREECDHYCC